MARPLNRKKSWYKVYIKELNTPNILKRECKEKCDYVYVHAYTGEIALSMVQEFVIESEVNFRPVYYNKVRGGINIESSNKVLFK